MAQVDPAGNVTLGDRPKTKLLDIRLEASPLPADLTDAERLALRTIVWSETGDTLVDFSNLPDLSDVPLKVAQSRWEQHKEYNSRVPEFSFEVYRSVLAKCGMRYHQQTRPE